MPSHRLSFKIASQPEEFEQIHALNYRTFVEEIPQHPPNPAKKLVDRFHEQNLYCICLDGQRLVGMLVVRDIRPFSLDEKVTDLDRWLPASANPCEIRLLAVEPEYRRTSLFAGLMHFAACECIRRGHTLAVASGTLRQTRLYRRMGFVPFAEPVGSEEARYQPMYLTLHSALDLFDRLKLETSEPPAPISFLPGPVELTASVRKAFAAPAVSHRSRAFLWMVDETRRLLCELSGARYVELFLGSGTLANDVVAAHLKVQEGTGVILCNGEFGERLIDHARRMGLEFDVCRFPWGEQYDLGQVESFLQERPQARWLWSTHCETSCGLLNDLQGLKAICQRLQVKICLDCTSSLGTVPVDLSEVFMASSVSGKGLASLAGIGLVFYSTAMQSDERIPRYLDLGYYRTMNGVPFTQSSNLVAALYQALQELEIPQRFDSIRLQREYVLQELTNCGISLMNAEEDAAPAVINFQLPAGIASQEFGESLDRLGYRLSYRSGYLLERNIIQICLMGRISSDQCRNLVAAIAGLIGTMAANHQYTVSSDKELTDGINV